MAEKLEKSERDPREYLFFTLANALKCIVISDPDTEHSAASMNVHIGSIFDPVPGLAHYLEHMLFMGTAKFPAENSFSTFLSENAGSSNAFTDNEDTNFYFRISSDQLHPALDMFSQFFISPLFDEGSLERELKAIDSEFHKNLQDDEWRILQILYNNAEKPINHFGLGNSSTLNIPGIRDKIIELYQNYYSANLMSLVVYGTEPTETLKEWVEELFSSILNKNVELPKFAKPISHNYPNFTKVIPVKDSKNLRIIWTMPNFSQHFECKPQGYIGHLLGHEGKNSLMSCLKKYNLADELACCHDESFSFCGFLSVEVKLTEKGLANYETVAEIIFAYVEFLKEKEPEAYIFHELKQIAEAQFLFKSKKDPYWFCSKLSARLEIYPPTKVLTAPDLYFRFDPKLIKDSISLISLQSAQIVLVSKTNDQSDI
jgi:insulysin